MRKKNPQKIKHRLISALILASMAGMSAMAQAPSPRPKLVVGIMIDGLNEDYLNLMKGYFSDGGFNRLINDGVVFDCVDFGTSVDAAAATAIIFTGTSPAVNGIPADAIYYPALRRRLPVFVDYSEFKEKATSDQSPRNLRVSTLSDEVRIDGGGIGSVYSIAPSASQAIIMGGHAGNSAYWIDEVAGRWVTTPYYKEIPTVMSARNLNKQLGTRLDTLTWRPSLAPADYPDLPAYKKYYPFRHLFQRNDKNRFRNYKTSAPVNTEVTDIVSDYIRGLNLGKHPAIDMINIGYTLVPFASAKDADNRLETMDSYLKLDADLKGLFSTIDSTVELDSTFVFVSGTPLPPSAKRDDEKWGIPNGEFSPRHAISLLNVYFMAKYGQAEWVSGYDQGMMFLNHDLIKERDLDLTRMRQEAADFLIRMAGVSGAWTIDDITASRAGNNAEALKRNTTVDVAGDIVVEVNPGWEIVYNDPNTQEENRNTVRSGIMAAPVFILAPGVASQHISTETDARSIAPTIARLLRIRSPNAAAMPPLRLQTAHK